MVPSFSPKGGLRKSLGSGNPYLWRTSKKSYSWHLHTCEVLRFSSTNLDKVETLFYLLVHFPFSIHSERTGQLKKRNCEIKEHNNARRHSIHRLVWECWVLQIRLMSRFAMQMCCFGDGAPWLLFLKIVVSANHEVRVANF